MAFYDSSTSIAYVKLDYVEHRLAIEDSYSIQDDVMEELHARGCKTIRGMEVNRPGYPDCEYEVSFAKWWGAGSTDYHFGAGVQYYLSCHIIRLVKVAA